jgi:vacuolar-type H+-ATPase subunit E/Vma4
MALPDLLRVLRAQAAERRGQEIADAERIAGGVRAESRAALDRRRSDHLASARREEEEGAHRELSRARAEAAAADLAARDRLLARVRNALGERIATASQREAYRDSLTAELALGLGRLPPGPVAVRTRPDLADLVRAAVGGLGKVEVHVSEDAGVGFLATAGTVEVDGTLSARLEQVWPRLAIEVLREAAS